MIEEVIKQVSTVVVSVLVPRSDFLVRNFLDIFFHILKG